MLAPALADPDPVVIFEHALLYNVEGDLTAAADAADIRSARVLQPGKDVTLIAFGGTVCKAQAAAEELAGEGIVAEVVDLEDAALPQVPKIVAAVRALLGKG
jgi:pyruvate dehydrogenase E1 component beta subunit